MRASSAVAWLTVTAASRRARRSVTSRTACAGIGAVLVQPVDDGDRFAEVELHLRPEPAAVFVDEPDRHDDDVDDVGVGGRAERDPRRARLQRQQ